MWRGVRVGRGWGLFIAVAAVTACAPTEVQPPPPPPDDCRPLTCEAEGKDCGSIADGCGGTLQCGSCSGDETCGGSGTPNVCGEGPCTPTTCEAEAKDCGSIADGCGGTLQCGSCSGDETCGGGGTPNVCGEGTCTPTTCEAEGKDCGTLSDGCGGTVSCGSCSGDETCGGGGTPNVCGEGTCTPTTCEAKGKDCGTLSDGCGGTLECGTCSGGETCGGGGTPNVCGTAQAESCRGLTPGVAGEPSAGFQMEDTVSYLDTDCGAGTSDGSGHLGLPRSQHSDGFYFVSPTGEQLGRHGGFRYAVHPQLSGFLGVLQARDEGYSVEILARNGEVQSATRLAERGDALSQRDPLGGLVAIEIPSAAGATMAMRAVAADGRSRWRVELPFSTVETFNVDRTGQLLVLADGDARYGSGTLAGLWVTRDGAVGDVFKAAEGLEERGPYELYPRVGGGLFLLRRTAQHAAWIRAFASLEFRGTPPPSWLRERPDTTLQMARSGRAYAMLPITTSSSTACRQRIEVLTPSGVSCGSATFGSGGGACVMREISVGYDGTVIQRLPEAEEECVTPSHCKCAWRWWHRFLK